MDNPPAEDRDNRDIRDNDNDNGEDEQEELSVTGRLDLGGSCPAIRTPNGDIWDLTGDLGDRRDGDQVRILGVAAGSFRVRGTGAPDRGGPGAAPLSRPTRTG